MFHYKLDATMLHYYATTLFQAVLARTQFGVMEYVTLARGLVQIHLATIATSLSLS